MANDRAKQLALIALLLNEDEEETNNKTPRELWLRLNQKLIKKSSLVSFILFFKICGIQTFY